MEKLEYADHIIKDTKIIYLSTQSSSGILLNGDWKSQVSYDLKNYLDFENDDTIDYYTVSMPYACIPNSNYVISEINNNISIAFPSTSSNFTTFTMPVGNYTYTTFISTFKSVISGMSIVLNQLTKKFSIGYADQFVISSQSSLSSVMGFSQTLTAQYGYNQTLGTTCYYIDLPRCLNLLPIPRFYIRCDSINNGVVLSSTGVTTSDVLMSVPNVSKQNSQIIYENNMDEFVVKNFISNIITISITDEIGNLINFNGLSSYFCLRFNIYRKAIQKPLKFDKLLQSINTSTNIPITNNDDIINIPKSPDELFN
jgi:hypothetical protein